MSLKLFSVTTLGLILLLLSCNQEELFYSCDPAIDSWVKENKETINVMSMDEFSSLDRDYQKASYIAFSPKQKKEIWVTKFTRVLNLDWKEDEKEHLEKLLLALDDYPNIFLTNCSEEYKDKFKVWIYQWINDGIIHFSWSPEFMKNLLFSPNPLLNKEGDIKVGTIPMANQVKTRGENTGNNPKCNCNSNSNYGEGFAWDDCSQDSHCVEGYRKCKTRSVGCGLMYLDACDGYCW